MLRKLLDHCPSCVSNVSPSAGSAAAKWCVILFFLTETFRFDWDRVNTEPISRFGVTPQEIEQVFANDPFGAAYDMSGGEERFAAMGHTASLRVLIVVWTVRDGAIRPLTAREPAPRQREIYLTARGFER